MDTVILTSIYREFWGTEQFRKSVERTGLPLHNAFKGTHFTGNGDVIRWIYEALVELKDTYKYAIYSDGADSYFLNSFIPPDNIIVYSTEKAVWPPTDELKEKWNNFWENQTELKDTPWKYLNGGGYCGPILLLIEFFEKYGLSTLKGDVNGQKEQAEAFLKAKEDGFPITLDTECKYFQTTGFAEKDDFFIHNAVFNLKTKKYPSVFHGNGRTDMKWLYNLHL